MSRTTYTPGDPDDLARRPLEKMNKKKKNTTHAHTRVERHIRCISRGGDGVQVVIVVVVVVVVVVVRHAKPFRDT